MRTPAGDERARLDEWRGGLVGGRGPAGRGWPRRHRRHPSALGWGDRLGLLQRRRRRGRPARRSSARRGALRLQPLRRLLGRRGGAVRRRVRRREHAESVRRVQPDDQVRSGPGPGPRSGFRRHRERSPRPRRVRPARHVPARRGADGAKDQSYVLYMLGQAELAKVVFPVGDLDEACGARRGQAPADSVPRRSRAWTCASSPAATGSSSWPPGPSRDQDRSSTSPVGCSVATMASRRSRSASVVGSGSRRAEPALRRRARRRHATVTVGPGCAAERRDRAP